MKKTSIIISSFLLIFQFSIAQNQKGDQNLGLSLNLSSGNSNDYYQGSAASLISSTYLNVNPNYSFFIANKLDIGASVGFGRGTDSYNNTNNPDALKGDVVSTYTAMLYMRKYYLFNNKIGIRTGPYLSYQYFTSNFFTCYKVSSRIVKPTITRQVSMQILFIILYLNWVWQ